MKKMSRKARYFMLATILLIFSFGCDLSILQSGSGSLAISLGSSARNITWTPPLDMNISNYTIRGTGPKAEDTFIVEGYTDGLFTRDGLAAGNWSVTVDGYNVDGIKVATSLMSVKITKGKTTAVTAVLEPLDGTGMITGSMSWTDSQSILIDPEVWITVRDEQGNDIEDISIPVQLEVSGMTASGSAELPVGWYEVTLTLKDGESIAWQGVFALRILKDQTTTATVTIPEEQLRDATGSISMTIEEDLDNPLSVSFSGSPETLVVQESITLTSTETYSGDEQYRWYVNGMRQVDETSSGINLKFSEAGVYTISLLVLDRGSMGGYGVSLEVLNNSMVQIDANAMWNDYTYISWQNLQAVYEPDKSNSAIDTWKINPGGSPIDGDNRILWNNQTNLTNGINLTFHYTDDSINRIHMSSGESGWISALSQDAYGNGIIRFTKDAPTATIIMTYTLSPYSSAIFGELNFTAKDYGLLSWGISLINSVWVNHNPGEIALYDKAYLNDQEISASEIGINPERVEGIDYLRDSLVSSGIAGIVSTERNWELSFELLETSKNVNLESHVAMSTIHGGWGFDRIAGIRTYLIPGESITIKGRFDIK